MKKSLSICFVLLLALSSQAQDNGYTPIQVEAQRWIKGQPDVPWEMFETRIIDNIHGFKPGQGPRVNVYGSRTDKKVKVTGYFRAEKIDGRWWVVDPEGYLQIVRGITGMRQGGSERNKNSFNEKFGSDEKWIDRTAEDFKALGFYGTGSWSDDKLVIDHNQRSQTKLSYAPNLNFMSSYGRKRGGTYQLPGNTGYPNQAIFAFDPEFETFCDQHASQVAQYKDDPDLLGYFSDNEMPLDVKNLEGYLTLENPKDPGRLAAENFLKEKGIRNLDRNLITDAMRAEFAGIVADRYYCIVSSALKKYDPNHMFLGSRLHGGAKYVKEILEAAGKYCDVVAINYYGVWTPQKNDVLNWELWAGKPFMITEFYTKAMDAGLANSAGAGYKVRTQKDRGYAYQDFCLALIESRNCVGWQFFKYQDNDPTAVGVDPSNTDSNKGIVDNDYNYYGPFTDLMRQLNLNVYRLADFFDATR